MDKKRYILIFAILVFVIGGGIFVWQYFVTSEKEGKMPEEILVTILDLQLSFPGSWRVENISSSELSIMKPSDHHEIYMIFSVSKVKDLLDFGSGRYNPRKIENGIVYDLITKEYDCRWGLELKGDNNFYYYDIEANLGITNRITEKQWRDNCNDLENVITSVSLTTGIKDETTDWQTYRSEEFGFEIKYPRDWQVRGKLEFGEELKFVNWDEEEETPTPGRLLKDNAKVWIGLQKNRTIGKLYRHFLEEKDEFGYNLVSESEEVVNNYPAKKVLYIEENSYLGIYWIQKGETVYALGLGTSKYSSIQTNQNFLLIFNRMLSTFKFVK